MRKRLLALLIVGLGIHAACNAGESSDEADKKTGGDAGTAASRDGGRTPGRDGGGGDPGPGGGEDQFVPPAPVPETITLTNETLNNRNYVLAVPKSYDAAKAYRLVLVFHGDGGDATGMRQWHPFETASLDDAIVAYPNGRNGGWDIYTSTDDNPDMQFVIQLVSDLKAKYTIDEARVFGVGYSSGGFFINKLACRKTGFFRGIVSHAGGAPDETDVPGATRWQGSGYWKCPGQTGGVAIMALHGLDDGDWAGGNFSGMYWSSVNGCSDGKTDTTPSPCVKYNDCPGALPVVWCSIPGLGHTIWVKGLEAGWSFIRDLN